MKIDMKRLAKLSKLTFSPEEEAKFEKEMEKIVDMVEQLPDIDASGALIDPDNPMELRKDVAVQEFNRKDLLQNAPEVQAGCIVVPKVME
ncbi:MAG: Asp-tRNA(Asn)/Glu-tRNA(Gln) amidotransferase subunit GatC [Oscillospiraceae bacterium]